MQRSCDMRKIGGEPRSLQASELNSALQERAIFFLLDFSYSARELVSDLRQHLVNAGGGFGGTFRKRAYLSGDDRKSPSCITGTCRLDGRVKGEKFCRLSNVIDGFGDSGNVLETAFQPIDHGFHTLCGGLRTRRCGRSDDRHAPKVPSVDF